MKESVEMRKTICKFLFSCIVVILVPLQTGKVADISQREEIEATADIVVSKSNMDLRGMLPTHDYDIKEILLLVTVKELL